MGRRAQGRLFQQVFARELKFEWPRATTPQVFKGAAAL
jgi:hypothetical protein